MSPLNSARAGRKSICMIDDSVSDAEMFQKALRSALPGTDFIHFLDGRQGMKYLLAKSPLPDLVLLDFWMPHVQGNDLLKAMRQEPRLRRLPVIMLSASDDPEHVAASYEARASAYIQKPVTVAGYEKIVKGIGRWLNANRTPPEVPTR